MGVGMSRFGGPLLDKDGHGSGLGELVGDDRQGVNAGDALLDSQRLQPPSARSGSVEERGVVDGEAVESNNGDGTPESMDGLGE